MFLFILFPDVFAPLFLIDYLSLSHLLFLDLYQRDP